MKLHNELMLRTFPRSLILSMLLLFSCGCYRPGPVRIAGLGSHVTPLINMGAANHHRLFGDLSSTGVQTFQTRAAVSLRQHTFTEAGADFDVTIDRTGERLLFASTRHNAQPDLYVKSVNGVAVTQLTADPAADIQPAISPSGKLVAFASRRGGSWDIWVINMAGGRPMQITSGPADDAHPSWSPDGKKLVYCSLPAGGGQWELWITDATTDGTKRFLGYGLFPEWSPTGDQLLFQRARERGSRWFSVWVVTLVNGEPSYPTELAAGANEAMIQPSWSPDGRRIVFSSASTVVPILGGIDSSGNNPVMDIWQMSADGRDRIRLTAGFAASYGPAFSSQGRVYFTTNRSGHENIWSVIPPPTPYGMHEGEAITRGVTGQKALRAATP